MLFGSVTANLVQNGCAMTGFTAIVLRLLAAVVPLCFGAAAMAAGND